MADKHFYRTIVEIEILSEEPQRFDSLREIDYEITDGHSSGTWAIKSQVEITPAEMAQLLIAQGSDTSFLGLDEKGNICCDGCDHPIDQCQCSQEVACKFVDENTHKCQCTEHGYYQMDCIGSGVCERWVEA